jgi:hypothetical protein
VTQTLWLLVTNQLDTPQLQVVDRLKAILCAVATRLQSGYTGDGSNGTRGIIIIIIIIIITTTTMFMI